jgi:hypothetical protein
MGMGSPSMTTPWRDERDVHLLTRGNVDGIVASAFFLARYPRGRVTYVPSSSLAVEVLRRDLSSRAFFLIDLGISPRLARTIRLKDKTRQEVLCIDHHQQSAQYEGALGPHAAVVVREGVSAATLAHDAFGLNGEHDHLAAVADHVEYCASPYLAKAVDGVGLERVDLEGRVLDFAWRCQLDDDRFRAFAARRLSMGLWPSEVEEIRRRYYRVLNENRWQRAIERVRAHLEVRDGVALLHFGKRKPSLFGFGTRALTSVAMEEGCRLALLVNERRRVTSVAMRSIGPPSVNLGRIAERFTAEFGVVGGGHPSSAGAKVMTRDLPAFLEALACEAA